MTEDYARAAGTDAGNRSMRAAGRRAWNDEDYNIAALTHLRWTPMDEDLRLQIALDCGFTEEELRTGELSRESVERAKGAA